MHKADAMCDRRSPGDFVTNLQAFLQSYSSKGSMIHMRALEVASIKGVFPDGFLRLINRAMVTGPKWPGGGCSLRARKHHVVAPSTSHHLHPLSSLPIHSSGYSIQPEE